MEKWYITSSESFKKGMKKFREKHKNEWAALWGKLGDVHILLNDGQKPEGKWIKGESLPLGMKELKQTRKGQKESRLYLYIDYKNKYILLLAIGTKDTQDDDIKRARKSLEEYIGENDE